MKIEADRRSRDVEPAPDAERSARRAYRAIVKAETTAAIALATVEQRRSYVLAGFRSVHAWARKVGYGPQQIHRLLELGRTLIAEPDLEEKVAEGKVPAETAAQIGRVLREGKLDLDPKQKDDWRRRAEAAG